MNKSIKTFLINGFLILFCAMSTLCMATKSNFSRKPKPKCSLTAIQDKVCAGDAAYLRKALADNGVAAGMIKAHSNILLWSAISRTKNECAELLVKHAGADVNHIIGAGWTLTMEVIKRRNRALTILFRDSGADLTCMNAAGETAQDMLDVWDAEEYDSADDSGDEGDGRLYEAMGALKLSGG